MSASDIFFSYAREDQARVALVVTALEARGWSVFWDRRIPAGKSWREHIGQALEQVRCVVVAWSEHSIKAQWVIEEAEDGRERNILLPIFLDPVRPPRGFRGIQTADLSNWSPERPSPALNDFLADLAAMLGSAPPGPPPSPTAQVSTGIAPEQGGRLRTEEAPKTAAGEPAPEREPPKPGGEEQPLIPIGEQASLPATTPPEAHFADRESSTSHARGEQRIPDTGAAIGRRAYSVIIDIISGLAKGVASNTVYYRPNINANKLANARIQHKVDEGEIVICLIDDSVFGSAKSGMLFTTSGIRYRNLFESPTFITYHSIAHLTFSMDDTDKKKVIATGNIDKGTAEHVNYSFRLMIPDGVLHQILENIKRRLDEILDEIT